MSRFAGSSTPADILLLQKSVLDFGRDCGATEPALARLKLILEEILLNIGKHAYTREPGRIMIDAVPDRKNDVRFLILEITDWGPPFNPLADSHLPNLDADLDERPIGGLGIHLVRRMASSVAYERLPTGQNRLVLSVLL
jgi:anti-sigma regulatory factor (Ser/Thr protein kinase)